MAHTREVERASQTGWIASTLTAGVMMSWAIAARNPSLFVPVVLVTAIGFDALGRGRRHGRMIEAYLRVFTEDGMGGPQWATRLARLRALPNRPTSGGWWRTCMAVAMTGAATMFSWLYAPTSQRGDLIAGIVTGCAIVFSFYALAETAKLERLDFGAYWRQAENRVTDLGAERRAG